MCKLFAGQIAKKTTAMAIEWCGGVGFTRDLPVEKFYRDAMVGQIYEVWVPSYCRARQTFSF